MELFGHVIEEKRRNGSIAHSWSKFEKRLQRMKCGHLDTLSCTKHRCSVLVTVRELQAIFQIFGHNVLKYRSHSFVFTE